MAAMFIRHTQSVRRDLAEKHARLRSNCNAGDAKVCIAARGITGSMMKKRFGARIGLALALLAAMVSTLTMALRWSDARAGTPTYSINFSVISTGGNTLHGNCYRLSGTVGQVAPGYSSASIDSLIAGYWQPAPIVATDEIFFSGFEGC